MIPTKTLGRKKRVQSHQTTAKMYRGISDRSNLLCLKPGYMMFPSPAEIFSRNFMINDLIIRNGNTEALWRGMVDLSRLKEPLCSVVDLGSTHIEVYPNQNLKPMAGRELNKKCFVTFSGLSRINHNKLKKICEQNECQILQLDFENKKFTVEIPHFSKYAFDEALDEEKQQQKEIESMKSEQLKPEYMEELRPFDELKKIHAGNLLKQTEQLRSVLGNNLVQKLQKNTLPTLQLQDQVQQHNQSHGNRIGDERIKGSPLTVGVNGIVSSFTTSKNMHGMIFNAIEEINRDNLKIVLQITKDDSKAIDYILDRSISFETRRVLALNAICFAFDKCRFQFTREKQKLQIVKIDRAPEEYYKPAYLKNWFEWVINEDKKLSLPQNQLLRELCLRRGSSIAEKYMNYKKEEDAQFLCSIEDQSYRTGDPPKSLSPELWTISLNNMSIFDHLQWIIKLGVCLWYYSFNDSVGQKISNILLDKLETTNKYSLQRHILITFFELRYTKNLLSPSDRQELPLWWLIANKNNEKESFLNNENTRYADYRYSIVSQLIQDYADSFSTLQLVSYDKFLSYQLKTRILALFIKKFPEEAQRVSAFNWPGYSDLINQNKGYVAYSNNEYFNALEYFGKCLNISQASLSIVKQISHKQQVLCSCYKKATEKAKKLLEKIPTKLLEDEINYLGVVLGTVQLTKKITKDIIKLSYCIQKDYLRHKMLQIIFECMMRSPNTLIGLKKDKQFFDFVYKIYTDSTYRLQLKIFRLSKI